MAKKKIEKHPGVHLSGKQVNDIALLFGGSIIKDGEDLIRLLKNSQQLRLADGIAITLTTDDLHALRQQSIGMSRPYEQYVQEFIEEAVKWQLQGFSLKR